MTIHSTIVASVIATTAAAPSIGQETIASQFQRAVDHSINEHHLLHTDKGRHLQRLLQEPADAETIAVETLAAETYGEESATTHQFSAECAAETTGIARDQRFFDVLNIVSTDCPTTFKQDPPITATSDYTNCHDDEAVPLFGAMCETLGGQFYTQDLSMECDIRGQKLKVDMIGLPECVGISCGDAEIQTYKEESFVKIVEVLAVQFPGIDCQRVEYVEVVENLEVMDVTFEKDGDYWDSTDAGDEDEDEDESEEEEGEDEDVQEDGQDGPDDPLSANNPSGVSRVVALNSLTIVGLTGTLLFLLYNL